MQRLCNWLLVECETADPSSTLLLFNLTPNRLFFTANCTGKVFGALRLCLSPYRDERQMNLSYMILLDMWNMFGQKFFSFIGG